MGPERARWAIWAARHLPVAAGTSAIDHAFRVEYQQQLVERLLDEAPHLALTDPMELPDEVQRILVWLLGWDLDTCGRLGRLIDAACRTAIALERDAQDAGGRIA